MQKETPDTLLDCIDVVARKISGAHIEFGSDDSIWLMPDDGINVTAVRWRSADEFLLGNGQTFSVFGFFEFMFVNVMKLCDDYRKLASLNEWMKPLCRCSSPEELRLTMACIG